MKRNNLLIPMLFMMLLSGTIKAQEKISFDLAGIRNTKSSINGLNVSCFYHFTERLSGGIEMNRFFPVTKKIGEEKLQISAWDFDLNFHYLLPLFRKCKWYPVAGVSHTAENEVDIKSGESMAEKFWSYNAGAGLSWELGKWEPHLEYTYTWGQLNQQFFLAGISYSIGWCHHGKKE